MTRKQTKEKKEINEKEGKAGGPLISQPCSIDQGVIVEREAKTPCAKLRKQTRMMEGFLWC